MAKKPAEFWAGAVFVVIGIAFFCASFAHEVQLRYTIGPGYFPRLVSALTIITGSVLMLRAPFVGGTPIRYGTPWRMWPIFASILFFALMAKTLGIIATGAGTVMLAACGWKSNIGTRLVLTTFVAAVAALATYLLDLPLPLTPFGK